MEREASVEDDIRAAMASLKEPPAAADDVPEETAASGDEPDAADTDTEADETEDDLAPEADEPDPVDPPHDWTADEQELFRSLDPKAREFALRRHDAAQQAASEASQTAWVRSVVTPERIQEFQMQGLSPADGIKTLLAYSDYANRDPAGFIKLLAQNNGIDLAALAGKPADQPDGDDESEWLDPAAKQVFDQQRREIAELKQAVQQLGGHVRQDAQQQQQRITQQIQGEIASFQSAVDDRGKPKYPYFNDVRQLMAAFMKSDTTGRLSLESAYEMATRAHPDTYAKLQAAQRANEARERRQRERDEVRRAQAAGSSVSGGAAGRSTVPVPDSVKDTIRAVMNGQRFG